MWRMSSVVSDLNTNRRAGRRRHSEIAHAHIGAFLEFIEVGDERVGLDDVSPCRAGGLETAVEILESLFHLGAHIALADAVAVDIARQLARGVDDLAGAAHCYDVRIGRLPSRHPDIHSLRLKPFDLEDHFHSPMMQSEALSADLVNRDQ